MKISKGRSILFILPFAICFGLFWLFPFLYGLFISFSKFTVRKGFQGFVGLENFANILLGGSRHSEVFYLGLKNTLVFVVFSVPALVLFSLFLALLIDRLPDKTQGLFRTIFFISYAISVTSVAAIFVWLFNGNGGYINNLLLNYGFISSPVPWLDAQPFATLVLVIATVWWTIGFNMMLFVNALNEIDNQLFEAASLDGAGYLQQLWFIILPSIKSVTSFVIFSTIIASFNLYGQPMLITKGGPSQTTKSLIMIINQTIFENNNLGVGNAMALLLGLVVIVFVLLQNLLSREKKELRRIQR